MDKLLANRLYQSLKSKTINGYKIIDLINNGKSAAVFKVTDSNGKIYALKIFDNDLIEKFGLELQEKRIEQELSLINHGIQNLVQIVDGGKSTLDNSELYFVVMEFISGENLKDFINKQNYDQRFIFRTLFTIKTVTDELLKRGVAHRDLKPENIMVSESGEIILMDLGVLKYIGVKSLTDDLEKQFLGTLRYAPPEYLMRREEDSAAGWQAVNLYQIGGVLHDLITKSELFHDKQPYANLVIAIKEDAPQIIGPHDLELLQLTRDLLTKDWKVRLHICTDKRIQDVIESDNKPKIDLEKELNELNRLKYTHKIKFEEIEKLQRSALERKEKRQKLAQALRQVVDKAFQFLVSNNVSKSAPSSNPFTSKSDAQFQFETDTNSIMYGLNGDLAMGYPKELIVIVRITNNESNYCKIQALGVFPSRAVKIEYRNPPAFLQSLAGQHLMTGRPTVIIPNYFTIFEGTFELDANFNNLITLKLLQLVKSALVSVEEIVKDHLDKKEKMALGTRIPQSSLMKVFDKSIFVNSITE